MAFDGSMQITLRYHALLREKTGRSDERLELPAGASAAEALARFFAKYPALAALEKSLQVAVNDEFAARGQALHEGDCLDLLPPFGGG